MRLSRGLTPKRSEPLNRMVTLLPGEQWRSRRSPLGKLLEPALDARFLCHYDGERRWELSPPIRWLSLPPTTNSKQQAKIPISAEPAQLSVIPL
jgi:hypothetical protein